MGEISRRTPTLYDVARRAGVSHQTVSRVVNGSESIRPETRDRVMSAIAELGYRRNSAARTLVTNRTHAIGILAPDVPDFGPTRTVQAIELAARSRGYHPLVTTARADAESILESLGFLLDQAVEALVVIAPQQLVLKALDELDITLPIVTMQSNEPGRGIGVSIDQAAGAEAAMGHLIELGHTRIMHLAGPLHYFEAAGRRDVYLAAMTRARLAPLPVFMGDWSAQSGYRAAEALDATTSAVFSGNDQMALGLIKGIVDGGRRVPEDVSVVGFDDVPEARFYSPPLTTVRQDFDAVGRVAVEAAIQQLENGLTTHVSPLVPTFIQRQSTAAPVV